MRISGTAQVGQPLQAHISDANGLPATVAVQWLRGNQIIAGATQASYTPQDADAGHALAVRAHYTDGAGHAENLLSAGTQPVRISAYVPAPLTTFVANVRDSLYGARGDGLSDDTLAIEKAIAAAADAGGGVVDIPAGTYLVNGLRGGLALRSNVTVRMSAQTVLQALPSGRINQNILRLQNIENAHVIGGTLRGQRQAAGVQAEGGFGVLIYSARNVVVEGVTAQDFLTDGFLVGRYYLEQPQPENIVFHRVVADNNRRQGLSITSGDHIKVLNSTFKNTNGADPESGIDIEPNPSYYSPTRQPQTVDDVLISGCTFHNNAKHGIIASANGDSVATNIRVHNNTVTENTHAILFNGVQGGSVVGNTTRDNGRAIPYFDIELRRSSHVAVRDNVMYGGRERNYTDGMLQGEGHTFSNNQRRTAVYMRGDVRVGQTLSAEAQDGNGLPEASLIQYQWYANGAAISGATAATYTVRAADLGKALSVRTQFTDRSGQAEDALSLPTAAVTP